MISMFFGCATAEFASRIQIRGASARMVSSFWACFGKGQEEETTYVCWAIPFGDSRALHFGRGLRTQTVLVVASEHCCRLWDGQGETTRKASVFPPGLHHFACSLGKNHEVQSAQLELPGSVSLTSWALCFFWALSQRAAGKLRSRGVARGWFVNGLPENRRARTRSSSPPTLSKQISSTSR